MVERDTRRAARRGWLRATLGAGGVGAFVAAVCWARYSPPAPAAAAQTPPAAEAAAAPGREPAGDYTTRVVAYFGRDGVVTREELGEYLIARRGAGKADLLANRMIIDRACREAGVEVTGAEVEAEMAADLKSLGGVSQADFVKQVLRKHNCNLVEWKEDVLRPRLMLAKLCRGRVQVSEEDLRRAFEARYGEKLEGRLIHWPADQEARAKAEAARARASEEEFARLARQQAQSPLAAGGGRVRPFGRGQMEKGYAEVERQAFRLRPGDVTDLVRVNDGYVVFKCDRRQPADTTKSPDAAGVREELAREVTDRKVSEEIQTIVPTLRARAKPEGVAADRADASRPFTPGISRGRVVGYLGRGTPQETPITREDLGEYLITRYGAESLDLLVNKRIIEDAARARGVAVTDAEVELALARDDERVRNSPDGLSLEKTLAAQKKTLYEYREDVVRPRLLLDRMCRARVKVTDEDLKLAHDAYYGEKVRCRMILWPREEKKFAMTEYARLRDSEAEFARKAETQASGQLAQAKGVLPPIGRHTTGNEELEREVFGLQPGQVSTLIETPQGLVVVKCDGRIPAGKETPTAAARDKLTQEILEKKVAIEVPIFFADLRKEAAPRLLIRDPGKPVDLTEEVKRDLGVAGAVAPGRPTTVGAPEPGRNPVGN